VSGVVFIDGAVVDAGAARVPVFDRGFLYGDSVYEVLRTFAGTPHAFADHHRRLQGSAERIGMAVPGLAEVEAATLAAIAASGEPECYLRIIVTRGAGPINLDPAAADAPRLIVFALPLRLPDPHLYEDGATLALVGARRNAPGSLDPMVKSGNYLNSVLAVAEARRKGAYEALMCDSVGRLAEGASSNLFIVKGGRIATPPLSIGLLPGITRHRVMALGRRQGVYVDEKALWPHDLFAADEAFITSSVRGVMPIVRCDDAPIGSGRPGPVTLQIWAAYRESTEGRSQG